MALKIVKSSDPIEIKQLVLCIYAPPGVGKTSLGFTADSPLDLDFDMGVHRASNRKDSVTANAWSDIEGMTADDLKPYKTIVVDTAGRALDKLSVAITDSNPKMGTGTDLTLKGWGVLKHRFGSWMKTVKSFGKDVVLICHMDEKQDGDRTVERLDAQGSSKNEIYKTADAMGRIFVREETKNGKRTIRRFIDFSPREGSYGKNPANLGEIELPDPRTYDTCLADIISLIKEKINQLSIEQQELLKQVQSWAITIDTLSAESDFNQMLPKTGNMPIESKAYFNRRAESCGFKYNPKTKLYEPKAAPAKTPSSDQDTLYA